METTKEKLERLQKQITTSDIKDVIEYIEDVIQEQIDEIEKNEPYATNTIKRYKTGLEVLLDIYHVIDEKCEQYDNRKE